MSGAACEPHFRSARREERAGKIDRETAKYMRDHGYDLRYYIESRWKEIGPQRVGKLHFFCGDRDNFYFNRTAQGYGRAHPAARSERGDPGALAI